MPAARRGLAAELLRSAREHRGHDHHARVHRPALEGVVEVLAVRRRAVDERGAGGIEVARVADRRAGPPESQAARART